MFPLNTHAITLELTDAQELLVRHTLALAEELEQVADTAVDGTVLDSCETTLLARGPELQRLVLTQVLQRRLDGAEKKTRRCAVVPVGEPRKTAAPGNAAG